MAEQTKEETDFPIVKSVESVLFKGGSVAARLPAVRDTNIVELSVEWISSNLPEDQINRILALATDVFGDAVIASEWLKTPNLATDNKPPIALLGTEQGFDEIRLYLHRIEHGLLA